MCLICFPPITPLQNYPILSYNVAYDSEIMPYIEIDKPQVVYRFSGNVTK